MNQHFTPRDLAQLEIEHFIFHIIVKDDDKPTHLDEVPLTDEQKLFFKKQFREAGKHATEYEFTDPESSPVVQQLKQMEDDPQTHFIPTSKTMATLFHSYHKGNAKDGVMILAIVRLDNGCRLLLILKLDNQLVLRYKVTRSGHVLKAILEEVTNPLVQSKETLQKLAIVDIGEKFAWDVLAFDRKTNTPRVGQYFENFLTMKMRETEVQLMEDSVKAVRQWATINRDELDEKQQISDYKERAIQYMELHDLFESDTFIEYVVQDENVQRKGNLKTSLEAHFEGEGIAGRSFSPKPEFLKENLRKHEIRTAEGVKVQWTGPAEASFISFKEPSDETEGLHEINIRTERIDTLK